MAAAGVGDRGGEGAHDLPRMLAGGVADEAGQIDRLRSAFLHAVGVEDQPVAGTQVEVLDLVGPLLGDPEGQIDADVDLLDPAVAQPQRPRMACVDELRPAAVESDAQQLAGGERAAAVVEQGLVRAAGLLGQVRAGASGAPRGVDRQGRHEGGFDVVARGVGDGQVQGVAVEGVVVRVTGDAGSGHQGAGEGELGCLAAGGRGKEPRWISAARLTSVVRWPQW